MNLSGGFWQNFKAAFGIGLGGGLGAGIGWRVGQFIGGLAVRLMKWIGFAIVGVAGSWYVSTDAPPSKQQASKPPAIEKRVRVEKPTPKPIPKATPTAAAQ